MMNLKKSSAKMNFTDENIDVKQLKKAEKQRLKQAKQKRKKQEGKTIQYVMSDLLPLVAWNDELNCAVMEDGTLFDMIQVKSRNLQDQSTDEKAFDTMCFDKLYKTYHDDLCLICFNYPTETSTQREYFELLLAKTENPIYKELIEEELARLRTINSKRYDREFVLIFYAKNIEDYRNKKIQILTTLQRAMHPLIEELTKEKKQIILYKLNNMTTTL